MKGNSMHYIGLSLCLFIVAQNAKCATTITHPSRKDGLGSQLVTMIGSVFYAELHGMKYAYTPFKGIEHNYNYDPNFLAKKEWLINFIDNFETNNNQAKPLSQISVLRLFQSHEDLMKLARSLSLKKIKRIFRENKNTNNYFNNNNLNIVVHIRRHNQHDNRIDGTNTPDEVYLDVINRLRGIYSSKNPLFHIHSQGNSKTFKKFNKSDIILHLDKSIEDSFIAMVLADVLVTSRSCFSYSAGLLSEGTIYYIPFSIFPLPHWITIDTLLAS